MYRERLDEIDGLRAIAILSVLFFHSGFSTFSGGFVGVDVFLVISGFVITRNIINNTQNGNFRLKEFYIRRFRRLYPALLTTITVTTLASVFILSPEHLFNIRLEVISSIFSLSNVYFWTESGYFQADNAFRPLLHIWSLSLEEQYYLLWPALLLFLLGLGKARFVMIGLLLLAFTSLLSSQILIIYGFESLAFYMLPFRVFEFILGGILALNPKSAIFRGENSSNLLSITGLLIILFSVLAFNESTPFPGVSALVPCIGAVMVICGGNNTFSRWVLINPFSQFTGKISYSLYLVHWPITTLFVYTHPKDLEFGDKAGIVIASYIFGYISWRYIEQRFRYRHSRNIRSGVNFKGFAIVSAVLISTTVLLIQTTNGAVIKHIDSLSPSEIMVGKEKRQQLASKGCDILNMSDQSRCDLSAEQQTLIIGNSHAVDGYNTWVTAFNSNHENIIYFGNINRCDNFLHDLNANYPDTQKCVDRLTWLDNKEFIDKLTTIVVSFSVPFGSSLDSFYKRLIDVKSLNPNLEIIILGGYFRLTKDCTYIMSMYGSSDYCIHAEFVEYNLADEIRDRTAWKDRNDISKLNPSYINRFELLCERNNCPSSWMSVPFAYDKHHLSLEFAQHVGHQIKEKFNSPTSLHLIARLQRL